MLARALLGLLVVITPALAQDAAKPLPAWAQPAIKDAEPRPMEWLRADAGAMLRLVTSDGARRFLLASNVAPIIDQPRIVHVNRERREYLTPKEWSALEPARQAEYEAWPLDEGFYYWTRYGSPHAYARALDLACPLLPTPAPQPQPPAPGTPEASCFRPGVRVLDFGFGGIVHLRLLATLGMEVHGVDVDPLLKAFYREPEDQGVIQGTLVPGGVGPSGRLAIHFGRWPGDAALHPRIAGEFDLIISKNTLKNGYINPTPEQRAARNPREFIDLGVSNDEFVRAVAAGLKPGGVFLIYNLCPAQKEGAEWIPWADGKCPFTRAQFEALGLEVIALDKEDHDTARAMGKALRWDEKGMDLQGDLFAWYTIVRRPAGGAVPHPAPARDAGPTPAPSPSLAPRK